MQDLINWVIFDKSIKNISDKDFKIVLSHDPTTLGKSFEGSPKKFDLTLSGHTHRYAIWHRNPGLLKWSPVQWVYKYWVGLYTTGEDT